MSWQMIWKLCGAAFLISGCYSPLLHIQSIAIDDMGQDQRGEPLIFYKECSRNGSAWLHECQSIGLQSMQQAIYLYHPNALMNHVAMTFYPKKTFIRFEVYDSSLLYRYDE